jgi:hypothetical protein
MRAKPITKQLDDSLTVARRVSMAGRRKTPARPGRFEATTIVVAAAPLSPLCLSPCIFATYEWFWGPHRALPVLGVAWDRRQQLGWVDGEPAQMSSIRRPRGPGYRGGRPATEVGVREPAGNVDRGKRCR